MKAMKRGPSDGCSISLNLSCLLGAFLLSVNIQDHHISEQK